MFEHLHVETYDELKKTLAELPNERRTFVLFTGGIVPETGVTWCPYCITALPHLYKAMESELSNTDSCFITCYVGTLPYWKNKENPFRTDDAFKVRGIPTVIEWGVKGKRLTGTDHLTNANILKDFFAED
ncbi:hypothetical protein QR680_014955 [Steinernema hermaphroditum]|uniref:Thioredoxin domain-containing protein 17 n=1 Tax=Steinernema hermaphroditum TaxID=289476 RepID=A0AA39M432_9BILA|nr:hypothetical protein QR680_014955 [Steinernema hermaphroditum]